MTTEQKKSTLIAELEAVRPAEVRCDRKLLAAMVAEAAAAVRVRPEWHLDVMLSAGNPVDSLLATASYRREHERRERVRRERQERTERQRQKAVEAGEAALNRIAIRFANSSRVRPGLIGAFATDTSCALWVARFRLAMRKLSDLGPVVA